MINNRFGLREEPFTITPATRFTYASQEHEEAFNGFTLAVVARRRIMALYGETGSGKTTLLQGLLDQLESDGTMVLAIAAKPGMTVEDLIQQAGGELFLDENGGQPLSDMDALVERLEQRLEEAGTGVLIVDEAQELDVGVLYDLVEMAASDTETGRFLQVLLAGTPDLERMLAEPGLEDTMRRLGVTYHLPPLERDQVESYIQERLGAAGAIRDDIFEPAAIEAIAHYSSGLLQLVNTLADVAVSGASRAGERTITRARVEQVARDLGLQPAHEPQPVQPAGPIQTEVQEPVARSRPSPPPPPVAPPHFTPAPAPPPRAAPPPDPLARTPRRPVQAPPPHEVEAPIPAHRHPARDAYPPWEDDDGRTPPLRRSAAAPLTASAYRHDRPEPDYRRRRWPQVAASLLALLAGAGIAAALLEPQAIQRLYTQATGDQLPWSTEPPPSETADLAPEADWEPQPLPVEPPPIPQPAQPPVSAAPTLPPPDPAPPSAVEEPPALSADAANEQRVTELVNRANRYIDQRLLTTPPGGNAFEVYQQIVQIAPQDPRAASILSTIKDTYRRWGATAEDRGQFDNAASFYRRGLTVDPADETLQTRLRELDAKRQAALAAETASRPESPTAGTAVAPPQPAPDQILRLPPDYDEGAERAGAASDLPPAAPNRFVTREDMLQAFQQPAVLEAVIQAGRDIDYELPDGKTALMLASEQGNTQAVRRLLTAGAAPNARSRNGGTALMYAASIGNNAIVRALIQSGGSVNSMNVEGKTALMAAASRGQVETVRILLENGANIGTTSIHGRNALSYAQEGGHRAVVDLLNSFDPQASSRRSALDNQVG
ncbi:ankyrin repeat domain-containing protein [Skermanella mucosa]|uniref:ankyrin repeat domain-containing protein n=1 Tax=Skermanella mucosa TaxID=1789672 RepID=UPI00192CB12C|nr:ankyrin repeat domain-containing protein [Skermanella mucosa]UEM22547.1 ankyrin repeat domain-containing protein [Skermanella mucosa]